MPDPRKRNAKPTASKKEFQIRSQAEGYGILTFVAVEAIPLSEAYKRDSESLRVALQKELFEAFSAFEGATLYVDVDRIALSLFTKTSAALIASRQLISAVQAKGEYEVRCAVVTEEMQPDEDVATCEAATLVRAMLDLVPAMQVLACDVSQATARRSLPFEYGLIDRGVRYLETPGRKIRIFQLTHAQLCSDFPKPLEGEEVWDILPSRMTMFFGREHELECLKDEIYDSSLVTLVGAGGIGKTSIAIQFAQCSDPTAFHHGAVLIDLSQAESEQQVIQAIAATLGVRAHSAKSLEECIHELIGHKCVLLIFDNCEQGTVGIAMVATRFRQRCRQVAILATSREPLYADGEQVIWLQPFATPKEHSRESFSELQGYDAVALFADRARKSQTTFELNESCARAVAEICRLLDGIPLAIELAASQIGPRTPADLVATLRECPLLGHKNSAPDRHRTMVMAIEWSVNLLTKTQRVLLARLSVFSGIWTLEAAQEVCGFGVLNKRGELQDILHQLIDKCLVVREPDLHAQSTYRFLMPIQAYAATLLESSGERANVRQRHFNWSLTLAERAHGELNGADQDLWLEIMHRQSDNLQDAFGWAIDNQPTSESAFKIIRSFYRYWIRRGLRGDPQTYMSRFLATYSDTTDPNVAMVYNLAGILADDQGTLAVSRRYLLTCYVLCKRTQDLAVMALALSNLSRLQAKFSNEQKALRYSRRCIRIFKQLEESPENNRRLTVALLGYSYTLVNMGRADEAETVLLEARRTLKGRKDSLLNISLATNFGELALNRGDSLAAEQILLEVLEDQKRIASPEWLVDSLILFVVIDLRRGSYRRAARLIGAMENMRAVAFHALSERMHKMAERAREECSNSIAAEDFESEYFLGFNMSICEVISYIRATV